MSGHLLVLFGIFGSAVSGLPTPLRDPDAAVVWLPSAVALAAALVLGPRAAGSIVVGAFGALWWLGVTPVTAAGVALGHALAAVVGAWVIQQVARGPHAFERGTHVVAYAGAATIVAATLSALVVAGLLPLTSPADAIVLERLVIAAWWADVTAALVLAPALVLWGLRPRLSLTRRREDRRPPDRGWRAWTHPRAREGWAMAAAAVLAATAIFSPLLDAPYSLLAAILLPFPILSWAALRFGARETATMVFGLGLFAAWGWLRGANPFEPLEPTLRMLQALLIVPGLTALVVAASIERRNRQDSEMHQLAVTDPLTGLANYRHLTASIERQIRRARDTGAPFALLLLDVDNLKVINDQHGHNVGSRLLVRLADALRASCRVTDLIARYGGDEFAVLLPGCDEPTARVQAARVQAALDADPHTPAIRASLGLAVFPRDGDSADELLDRADDALYAMKRRPSRQ